VAAPPALGGLGLRGHWRLPAGDDADMLAGPGDIGDAGEAAAQFDGGRQLAALIERTADSLDSGFIDCEHALSMGAETPQRNATRFCQSAC
jgi:hypothetical protein